MCDCLTFRLDSYISSLCWAGPSSLRRLWILSSVLWPWFCESSAALGTAFTTVLMFASCTHTRHIQNKEKNIVLFQSLSLVLDLQTAKMPSSKVVQLFFLHSFNAVLYCIFLVMIKSMAIKWITFSLWVLKGLFAGRKKVCYRSMEKKSCQLIWVAAYVAVVLKFQNNQPLQLKIHKRDICVAKNLCCWFLFREVQICIRCPKGVQIEDSSLGPPLIFCSSDLETSYINSFHLLFSMCLQLIFRSQETDKLKSTAIYNLLRIWPCRWYSEQLLGVYSKYQFSVYCIKNHSLCLLIIDLGPKKDEFLTFMHKGA